MNKWFKDFSQSLLGEKVSTDLIGAGSSNSESAMAHYRFQHQAKVKEAIEETFPVLMNLLDWEEEWEKFWQEKEESPRSLDFLPGVFLKYLENSKVPEALVELARFELDLETYSWNHGSQSHLQHENFSEESSFELGDYEVKTYKAPVTQIYEEEKILGLDVEKVLLWHRGESVHYRSMAEWELKVLDLLRSSVGEALEAAPEDAKAVGEFFSWLGSSHLIRKVN